MAAREVGDAALAEDVVQDALLAAVRAGRTDLTDGTTARWLHGVVRNQARMSRRGDTRRRRRDDAWHRARHDRCEPDDAPPDVLAGLPPSLRTVAVLVLTGHDRDEIGYLLQLSDVALRQRISVLKRKLREAGLVAPDELVGLGGDLAFGRIREALVPLLSRQRGVFATHDPDGHLFVVRRSRTP